MGQQTKMIDDWQLPDRPPDSRIGAHGYGLPSHSSHIWHQLPGQDNWLVSADPLGTMSRNHFDIGSHAKHNLFLFGEDNGCFGHHIVRGSNNVAVIFSVVEGHHPINVYFHVDDCIMYFGKLCSSNTTTFELGGHASTILIGQDCMFSSGIHLMTSDEHAVFDRGSRRHLNSSADIILEPHVWVGFEALILKGVRVGFGSIIGARAVVTRDVPPNSIAAGNPARIVRTGIGWVRDRSPHAGAISEVERQEAAYRARPCDGL